MCEFIEDCEFTMLSTQILHLLGVEGPTTADPDKYIRFIYNRVVLENATVRASAISALSKFGMQIDSLRPSIIVLLQRCLYDNDDEVRDRAIFFVGLLKGIDSGTNFCGLDGRKTLLEPLPDASGGASRRSRRHKMRSRTLLEPRRQAQKQAWPNNDADGLEMPVSALR